MIDDPSIADVAIIGGGAAGLATAIFAARHAGSLNIVVLDGARKLGAKILVSGGGRCNVTNAVIRPEDYWGGSRHIIKRVLDALPVARTIDFFREIGVSLHEEEIGKLFPDTNDAHTVLDALVNEAARLKVRTLPGHRVHALRRAAADAPARFEISTQAGALQSRRVVLATGGKSLPKTGSDGGGYEIARSLGHCMVPTTPALAPLLLDGPFHAGLSGITHTVALNVRTGGGKSERLAGSMLWTHIGISGPVAMNASRIWHRAKLEGRAPTVTANFLPGDNFESVEQRLLDLAAGQPKTRLHNALGTLIPARLADALLASLAIRPDIQMSQLSREDRRKVVSALLAWPLPVRDSRGYAFAEATAGGVPLTEIDPTTMQSRKCHGLFLVGEILDVDGRIGGFNFQWAWSSGFVAGTAIAAPTDTHAADQA